MKKLMIVALAMGAGVSMAADRHAVQDVQGKGYWTILSAATLSDPASDAEVTPGSAWDVPALRQLDVFRDCIPSYHSDKRAPGVEKNLSTWKTIRENFNEKGEAWRHIEKRAKPDKPLLMGLISKRSPMVFGGQVDVDKADYEAWKAAHPGFWAFSSLGEWDNDFLHCYTFMTPPKDAASSDVASFFGVSKADPTVIQKRRDEVKAFFGPMPKTRQERVALYKKYFDRVATIHYGDTKRMAELHASINIAHLAAQWGGGLLALETTNTSGGDGEYRWAVSGMFQRGAARQFQLPWVWYVAIFMNGYNHDGQWVGNSVCNYLRESADPYHHGVTGPEGGVSRSLNRRAWYYAYLNGANAVQQEGWQSVFLRMNKTTNKIELSPRGEDFVAYHKFTKDHPDRGVTYTPVAVLVPNDRGYTCYGGCPFGNANYGYTRGDEMTDAVFFTLQPTFERDIAMKRGTEANLYNSPHPMMYDAITPDAQQTPAERLATFRSYKALILTGDYTDRAFEKELAQYEKEGGKVIRITDADMPARKGSPASTAAEVLAGHRKYPAVEAKLAALEKELFPVTVTGDCQYGINKTATGWWFWAFHNKGVIKFANAPESFVPRAKSTITVALGKTGAKTVTELRSGAKPTVKDGAFTVTLAPGEFGVWELK